MLKDSHVHTNISHDGTSSMQDYILASKEKDVDEITFTEHLDIYDGVKTTNSVISLPNYFKEYGHLDSKDIKTNIGIEVSLMPDIACKIESILSKYPFDFIIGSSHIVNNIDIGCDPSFFYNLTKREAYMRYFEEVLKNITIFNDFDVYGHLDYIIRYGNYKDKRIVYTEYREILDAILEALIRKDKGIEINTSGIRYGLNAAHPNLSIIKRYKDLGGKIITIGSDAHRIEDLAANFDYVYDLLSFLNIKEYAVYHNREPEFEKVLTLKKAKY